MNWTVAQIASVVLCAMGSGLILSTLGHSPVLGYIIAGVVLGPSCLQFITDRETVAVFSEMGILFLLFAIGLNLSLDRIRYLWKTSLISTIISAVFIYILMLIVGYFFKIPQTGIILMTFCVTLSSTAVTVKSLNLLRNLDVDIREQTFGILIAQDIIALFMVLIVDFMGFKQRSEGDIYKIIAILVFIAIVFLAFLRLPRYAHKLALLIRKHKEMLTMFVFGVCLGSALFAEVVGLSASCGAFISGLLFGNSGIKEEVKNVTLPIEELLLMTFFLSIGLLVDINFIAKNLPIIFAGLLFVAFGKTIINILVMRLCKFSLKESFVMGVLLGHIGEFSFMLSHTANKAGIINIYGEKFLISLTALSLFLSPFWLVFAERCRTLAENTHVNSWAFFRLALDREIQKTRYITTTIKSGCATQLRYLWDKLMDIAEMLKRK